MKLDLITNKQDEFYTPAYAVKPLLKYIAPKTNVLCPFDTVRSEFVKQLDRHGCNVTHTHIFDNIDFWDIDLKNSKYDYIISNPPYSCKGAVLSKLFDSKVPFAMLLGVVGLFESQKRFEMFRDNEFEIMYFNRRVSYFDGTDDNKPKLNPPFSSVYITSKILPQKIIFEEINKKDF